MTQDSLRRIALAILNADDTLNRRSASYLGQCCATRDTYPPTEKQLRWLADLARRADLSHLFEEANDG